MSGFATWAARHPQAAAELQDVMTVDGPAATLQGGEAAAQQQIRLQWAAHSVVDKHGVEYRGMSWRNNVGATPAKCPSCNAKQQPIRYGLSNDSAKLNEKIKSHDLIGIVPRLITPDMLGSVIGQFGSVEAKRPGWTYTGRGREEGQATWGALILRSAGFAKFSTGDFQA